MPSPTDSINNLRDALAASPDNIPLRRHLAETLLGYGELEQAEQEYRKALSMAPNDPALKVGLANAFYQQGKNSEALVIVESLTQSGEDYAPAYILYAKLLFRAGEIQRAVHQYRAALDADPDAADEELAERLGVRDLQDDDDEDAEIIDGRIRESWGERTNPLDVSVERPAIRFKDVGGMEKVKDEIRMKIISPLEHPELFEMYGKKVGGGVLMYGPPGCGKTHLARATAGEIKAGFISVGINEVLEMWIGQSERNLHEIFEQARRNTPCVLFFDEVDALGASRSDMQQSTGRHLINQFLSELDGIKSSNEGVLILAATNAPWHLDTAFRRPGRFDRVIFVSPPDSAARSAILRILAKGKPLQDVDFDYLGKKLDHFSGADLKAVVDVAVERKLEEALKTGKPAPLKTKDLQQAAKQVKPSTREWFATAKNYALYSNQGGIYDDIRDYLKL